jgi:hypothetical protein
MGEQSNRMPFLGRKGHRGAVAGEHVPTRKIITTFSLTVTVNSHFATGIPQVQTCGYQGTISSNAVEVHFALCRYLLLLQLRFLMIIIINHHDDSDHHA